jgi:hypothetical protein
VRGPEAGNIVAMDELGGLHDDNMKNNFPVNGAGDLG